MRGIQHVREPLTYYLGSTDFLERYKNRIFYIGRQETLDDDVVCLKRMLGIEPEVVPPSGMVDANRAPPTMCTRLSKRAIGNIKSWYEEDYPVMEWCLKHRENILEQNSI